MPDMNLIIIISFLLVIFIYLYFGERAKFRRLLFDKQSLSVKYGKMAEQFLPFMKNFKYDPQNFRFIGTPIDGIQFEDDKIVFIEFKSGKTGLTGRQRRVKELVEQKRVQFEEKKME